jgi:tetratricopeptide (TPR) repeat protein
MSRTSRQDSGGRQGPARPGVTVLVILLLLATWAPLSAHAQDSMFNQARAYMADGNPEQAYGVLAPHEPSLAGDPGFDYLLGIAAMDSGRLTNAVFALERVLAVQPDNVLARAEIARVYLMLGELQTSKREFETVQAKPDVPPEARQAIERYLTAFRVTPEEGADFKAFVAVTVGYDSNVNAASDISGVAIPAAGGAIFQIDPLGIEASDIFTTIAAGGSVSMPLSDSLRLNAGVNAYSRLLNTEKNFETASVNGYAGLDWTRRQTIYTLAAQGEHFQVDDSSYRNAYGGLLQVRHIINAVSQVTGYGQFARLDYSHQPIRDANRYTVGAAYSQILAGSYTPSFLIGGFGGTENPDDSSVEFLGYNFGGLRTGGQIRPRPNVLLFTYLNWERRSYEGQEPLFATQRRDTHLGIRFGSEWTFYPQWTLTPAVDFIRNDSNIPIHDFNRWIASLMLRVNID